MDENQIIDQLYAIKNNEEYRNILMDIIIRKEIPESYPMSLRNRFYNSGYKSNSDLGFENFKFRDIYTTYCSWCMVSTGWIKALAKLLKGKNSIEIMAGRGLVSYALQQEGVDIKPSDNLSWGYNASPKYTEVLNADAVTAIKNAKDLDYVLCSWPPYEETDICDAIKVLAQKHPSAKLIYIGEDIGGCTGCTAMFDMLDVYEGKDSSIIEEANQYFTRFEEKHDYIYILKPNHKAKLWKKKNVLKEDDNYDD
ncbi:MAG: hypothetical protein IKR19_07695 [Acholeplasmatales bacterium]|nr:hypothetical protein [Acholeplasmatales bacterium]